MPLSDHKAVIALALINSKPFWDPRWYFNTTPLHDKAFKNMFSSQLMDFVEINKGSVDYPRILWDAIIRNFAFDEDVMLQFDLVKKRDKCHYEATC